MGSLAELLAAGERQTLEFFVVRLKEVSEPTVDHQELLYNASVLAHYALVSTRSATDVATPATLATEFLAQYRARFGFHVPGRAIVIDTIGVTATGRSPRTRTDPAR